MPSVEVHAGSHGAPPLPHDNGYAVVPRACTIQISPSAATAGVGEGPWSPQEISKVLDEEHALQSRSPDPAENAASENG